MADIDKAKLLQWIQTGYTAFKILVEEFHEEQLTQPDVIGEWSLKDIMAHILVHEQRMVQWMSKKLCGEDPFLFQPYAMPNDELDKLNEQIFQENRHRSFAEMAHTLEVTHSEVLHLVETTADKYLFDANCYRLLGGEPLWEAIAANTCWHYEEHGQGIRKWRIANRIKAT
jgi:hypothetical protein